MGIKLSFLINFKRLLIIYLSKAVIFINHFSNFINFSNKIFNSLIFKKEGCDYFV